MHGSKGAAWPDGRLEGAQASAAQSGGKAESAMGQTVAKGLMFQALRV